MEHNKYYYQASHPAPGNNFFQQQITNGHHFGEMKLVGFLFEYHRNNVVLTFYCCRFADTRSWPATTCIINTTRVFSTQQQQLFSAPFIWTIQPLRQAADASASTIFFVWTCEFAPNSTAPTSSVLSTSQACCRRSTNHSSQWQFVCMWYFTRTQYACEQYIAPCCFVRHWWQYVLCQHTRTARPTALQPHHAGQPTHGAKPLCIHQQSGGGIQHPTQASKCGTGWGSSPTQTASSRIIFSHAWIVSRECYTRNEAQATPSVSNNSQVCTGNARQHKYFLPVV